MAQRFQKPQVAILRGEGSHIIAVFGLWRQAVRRAGVRDGLLLLDEVDKMGRDARGDPAAALLEVRISPDIYSVVEIYTVAETRTSSQLLPCSSAGDLIASSQLESMPKQHVVVFDAAAGQPQLGIGAGCPAVSDSIVGTGTVHQRLTETLRLSLPARFWTRSKTQPSWTPTWECPLT